MWTWYQGGARGLVPVATSLTSRGPFVVRLKPCPVLLSRTGSLVICSVSLAWKYWLDTLLERCDLPSPSNRSLRRSNKATCYQVSLCELENKHLAKSIYFKTSVLKAELNSKNSAWNWFDYIQGIFSLGRFMSVHAAKSSRFCCDTSQRYKTVSKKSKLCGGMK